MKSFYLLLPLCLVISKPLSATGNHLSGSRAAGLANSAVALHDFWAISHNQAGIADFKNITAGMYAGNRFMLSEMVDAAIAAVIPAAGGNLGVSLQYFGTDIYTEGKAGIAYARLFGDQLSAGVQLNYIYTNIAEGYGQTGTFLAELGLIYEIFPGLFLGTHVFNPTKSAIKTKCHHASKEYISAIVRTGLVYALSSKVLLSAEIEKDLRHPPAPRIGVEYQLHESLHVRAGLGNNPLLNTFGFGIYRGKLQLDISASHHYLLGYSQQAGLIYTF